MAVPDSRPNWFDQSEFGVPQITDTAGSFIGVLKACLVNGFNVRPITQIVVTSGVAVATAADHGYSGAYGKLLLVEGSAQAGLNGRVQATAVTTNTFTYACPGVADGTYTGGGVTARRAPLGWSVAFENGAATEAVFQRLDGTASSAQLHVLDTRSSPAQTYMSQVSLVEAATAFNAFSNQCPGTIASRSWHHGDVGRGNRNWRIVGDRLGFWALLQSGQSPYTNCHPYWAGDHVPMYAAEVSAAVHIGYGQTPPNVGGITSVAPGNFVAAAGHAFLTFHKAFDGSSINVAGSIAGAGNWGRGMSTPVETTVVAITGDYYTRASGAPLGRMPGLFLPQSNVPFTDLSEHYLEPINRVLVAFTIAHSNTGTQGQMMLDLTGPWR